jgi:hypothetical protein
MGCGAADCGWAGALGWARAGCTFALGEMPPLLTLAEKAEREEGEIMRSRLGRMGVRTVKNGPHFAP